MGIRKIDLIDSAQAPNGGSPGLTPSASLLSTANSGSSSFSSFKFGGAQIALNGSHSPGNIGGGATPQDFSGVHLETDGSHWILTDGVDSIVLEGATAVTIDGQTYQLVDQFGATEGGYQSIQAGVDAAAAGDIVMVAGGTYVEQVVVDGRADLKIEGLAGDEVNVEAPADVVQYGTSGSGRALNSVITVEDSTDIEIANVNVDGAGHADTVDGASANFVGVSYRNSSGGMTDVDVTGIRDPYPGGTTPGGHPVVSGIQRGVGVQVDNDTLMAFFLSGGSISDFQKNATVFNRADLDVSGVTVTGGGDQTINAQNGMQAGNCTGAIYDCLITALGYAGTSGNPALDPYSGGILLTGNNTDLAVHDNTVIGANGENSAAKIVGIYVYDGLGANNGGGVYDNDVSFADTGVGVFGAIGPSGYDVHGNSVTDVDPTDYYYLINPGYGGVDFEPTSSLTVGFVVSGSEAADYLAGATAADTLSGVDGDDFLFGNDGADTLYGGAGVDELTGSNGNDYLDGGTNADDMTGGLGKDTYVVDNLGDVVTETGAGKDTVFSSIDYTLGTNLENLTLTGSAVNGTGNEKKNNITGNSVSNNLDGADHNDKLSGKAGNDVLTGGQGHDVLSGNTNSDTLIGGTGNDTLNGGGGKDTMTGSADSDVFLFEAVADSGNTNNGADVITDFVEGGTDEIDLSAIDANSNTGGNEAFVFIGGAAFSGTAGELRTYATGGDTYVAGDVDGGGSADFIIRLSGGHGLAGTDFDL